MIDQRKIQTIDIPIHKGFPEKQLRTSEVVLGEEAKLYPELLDYVERLVEDLERHKPSIKIYQRIGGGGFAHVFAAAANYLDYPNSNGKVAVKVLMNPAYLNTTDEMRKKDLKRMFWVESVHQDELSKQLKDKVVQVYDYGEFSGHYILVMEHMGDSIRGVIEANKEKLNSSDSSKNSIYYPLRERVKLMISLADTTAGIHRMKVIHGDIKPENILFPDGFSLGKENHLHSIKLADFGLARGTGYSYSDRVIRGTLRYMPLEQIIDPTSVDEKADIYSCSMVSRELIGGVPVAPDSNGEELEAYVRRRSNTHLVPLRNLTRAVEKLDKILMKGLAPEPEKRFQKASDLRDALMEYYKERFN